MREDQTPSKKVDMGFLKSFTKDLEKMEGISTSSAKPRYAYSTGNYVLNKITSGSFYTGGIACQGRVGNISGPSGAGKSFLLANVLREAQAQGAHILMLDSEGAFDDDFVKKINIDPTSNYTYIGITTFQQVANVVSQFLKGYKKEYPNIEDAPKVVIALDSLDMLLTESESDHYDKGVQKGDQGQRAKTMKHMLRTFVQDIKALNVSIIVTSQFINHKTFFLENSG
jgi:RecA/RadA recombinase